METGSFITGLVCPKCGKQFDYHEQRHTCGCGSPLLVEYDLKTAAKRLLAAHLRERETNLWRYRELLPVLDDKNIVSLGEGWTPLTALPSLSDRLGVRLLLKDEGVIPTGTFKARGAAVGVSRALELGAREIAMPTNGNAGAAWALYAARAGITAHIVMPEAAPAITRSEVAASGADLRLVKGLISDCGKIVAREAAQNGWYDASTLKEPYRIEGKKTMGYEIAEQLHWSLPDVIAYPTGGGVGLIGIYKALVEMQSLGWISGPLPRLVAVQAAGCAPIVEAYKKRAAESVFFPGSKTVAFGINVPKALGDFLVLDALYKTDGEAVAVDDGAILDAMRRLAQSEGVFVCPEGAAVLAGLEKLRAQGWLRESETAVILNTGAGIKYPDTLHFEPPYVEV